MVWKCALKAGSYLASVCDSICPKTLGQYSSRVRGQMEKPTPAPCSCSETGMLLLTPHPDSVIDKQTQNNKPTTSSSRLNMSVLFMVPERDRGTLEVCLQRLWLSVISVPCLMLYKTSNFKIKEKWDLYIYFFIMEHQSFQSLGSVQNEIPIERKKLLILL